MRFSGCLRIFQNVSGLLSRFFRIFQDLIDLSELKSICLISHIGVQVILSNSMNLDDFEDFQDLSGCLMIFDEFCCNILW